MLPRGGGAGVTVDVDGGLATTAVQTSAAATLGTGQQFGRYHILRLLGSGGMGTVYQAWDDELGVAVALKIIRTDAAADPLAREDLERRVRP